MKKLSIVLLAVLLIASLIISCDNSTKALTDELVEVQLGTQAGSRALSSSVTLEQISDSSLTWHYSATKTSQREFKTGETTDKVITLGTTETFSQGKWNFELWAMKDVVKDSTGAVTNPGKKVYYGNLTDVLITKSASPVSVIINVSPYVENENGTLVFDEVKIKAATSTQTIEVTIVPNTVTIGTNNYTLDNNGSHEAITLSPGQHEVYVAYVGDDGIVYASETKTVTIYSNRVTTLSGMIDEETTTAEITVVGTAATVKKENIEAKEEEGESYVNNSLTISAPVTPSKAVDKTESGVTVQNTDVTFDEGAFNLTGTSDKAELKIDTTSIEDSNFAIEGTDAESGLTSVAGLDIVLKVNDSDVTTFNENKYATVSTYIAKNLTNVGVRYKNPTTGDITSYTIETVTSEPTTITGDGYYIASTGKLVFKTTHFSEYYVVANARAYIKESNTAYSSLTQAINAVDNGQTVVILESYALTDTCTHPITEEVKDNSVSVNNGKTFTIDFNAKTVTGKMYIQSGFVTLKNGVFGGLDQTINIYGNTEDIKYNSVTIEKGMTITTATNGYGIILRDRGGDQKMYYGTTVNVNGTINAGTSGIFVMGNIINAPESTVNPMSVFVGSTAVINADGIAINQNGLSYVVINNGATLSAVKTAVEVRAGELEINGGTFQASARPTSFSPNGSGSSTVGAAVAIAQHTTKQPIYVEINGGTFTAYTALNEADPQNNNLKNVSIVVNGGTFNMLANQESGVVVNSNSKVLTISGGTFQTDPTGYVKDAYVEQSGDNYNVTPLGRIEYWNKDFTNGALSYREFPIGVIRITGNVTLTSDVITDKMIFVPEGNNVTIDLNGHKVESKYAGFSILNYGNLTINDASSESNGIIYNSSKDTKGANDSYYGHDVVRNYGTLTINGGTFGDADTDKKNANDTTYGAAIRNQASGTVTINGGNFTCCDNYGKFSNGDTFFSYALRNYGTMTIKDGTVVYGKMNGCVSADGGSITIDGGNFSLVGTNTFYVLVTGPGAESITVNGGTFNRTGANRLLGGFNGMPSWDATTDLAKYKYTINGGTFTVNEETITLPKPNESTE